MSFSQTLIDPTMPQDFIGGANGNEKSTDNTKVPFVVSAVFIKDGSKLAVINGDSVAEGQSWKGNKVKSIHKNGVVLIVQGRETELNINQFSIKKDVSNDF